MAEPATTITYVTLAVFFFCVGLCSGRTLAARGALTPVVLIPGHGGNQMEMNIDRENPILPKCSTSTKGWAQGWLSLWHLIPGNLECWIEHNKMTFDPATGEYANVEGVSHRVPGWGGVESIEYLDPSLTAYVLGNVGSYFAPLIHTLEQWGYKRGVNLRGAPYDFRFSPVSIPDFHEPLRELIEDTYDENGNARVALVSHSMGGLMAYYFLQKQTPEWNKKYIHSMTTMNTPWKGVVSMVEAIVSGYTWGFDGMHPNTFRIMQQSCESGVFLLPSPSNWGTQEVLVKTDARNYTSGQYRELFEDMGYPVGTAMWHEIEDDILDLDNPGVDTWCFYSSGKETPEALIYESGRFPNGPPKRVMGDGDGTSNLRSASACKQWSDTFDNLVVTKEFKDTSHNGILSSEKLFQSLKEVIMA